MMMSLLGSIDLFIEVYVENTVNHVMSGKAVLRAVFPVFPHKSNIDNTFTGIGF